MTIIAAPPKVQVIKAERFTTVELLATGAEMVVRKTYRTEPWLRWRTLWLPCRAWREYRNLSTAVGRRVPCIVPLGWTEDRRRGAVLSSTIWTRWIADAPSLKQELARVPRGRRERRRLAAAYGVLLARVHEAGIISCRASPRNVLVPADGTDLIVCDLPAALLFRVSQRGRWTGSIDLYDAAFSHDRRQQFTRSERLRIVRAYHQGDTVRARSTWRTLARRPLWIHRATKAMLSILFNYLGTWLRQLRADSWLPKPIEFP